MICFQRNEGQHDTPRMNEPPDCVLQGYFWRPDSVVMRVKQKLHFKFSGEM